MAWLNFFKLPCIIHGLNQVWYKIDILPLGVEKPYGNPNILAEFIANKPRNRKKVGFFIYGPNAR